MQASNKDEVQEMLNELMKNPGTIGYVVINFDGKQVHSRNFYVGIPVKHYPDDPAKMPAV